MNPPQQIQPTQRPNMNVSGQIMFEGLMNSPKGTNIEAVVEKRSSTNMFWNKRSITLIDGVLSYYSKVHLPNTDYSKTASKASVKVINIVKLCEPDKVKKPNSIQITFLRRDRLQKIQSKKTDLNASELSVNTSTNQQNAVQPHVVVATKKEVCIWEFAFTNPQQLKQFMQSVELIQCPPQVEQKQVPDLDAELKRQKYEEERKLEKERLEEERQLRNKEQKERQRVEEELQKQQMEMEREMLMRKEQDKKTAQEKAMLQQQLLDSRETERLRLLKETQEHQKRQLLKLKLSSAWNYKFIQAIELAHAKKVQLEESVEASFLIHKAITAMKVHAMAVCKQIIDELVLPNEMKKYKPTQSQVEYIRGVEGADQPLDFGDDIFIVDGLFIKLAFTQIKIIVGARRLQIYDETSLKSLGHEFRCMSLLADVIEERLQCDPYFPMRVPLSILLDYKGVRAFALALPPTNNETQVVGLQSGGNYLSNPSIFEQLCQISTELNLKVHQLTHEFTTIEIPQSLFTEVHQVAKEEYLELRWIENDSNLADFAPQHLNLLMMQKCADLMPIYVDLEKEIQFTQRLRPEFLQMYFKQLNSDALLANSQGHEEDDQDVIEASKYLRREKILDLLHKLECLDYLPIDSQSLTDCFHRMGVNMRLLGLVCAQSTLPHVKQICIIEMVARVCKKVLRNNLADLIQNLSREVACMLRRQKQDYLLIVDVDDVSSRDKIMLLQSRLCLESALDFFNLVLGTGQESDIFWKQILHKQVWFDYDYQFDVQQRFKFLPKGLLLQSLLHQCDFAYEFDKQTLVQIFETAVPLRAGPRLECLGRCHYYQLMRSRVGQVVSQLQTYKQQHNKEMLKQSVKWALQLHQIQCEENRNKIGLYLSELAEYDYSCGDIKQAELKAQEALGCMQPIHVNALTPLQILIKTSLSQNHQDKAIQLFQQSLLLLETQLGESHPIHSILYCILAHHYMQNHQYDDSYTLYKSGLISSQRVLGSSHQHTAQIYTDIGALLTKTHQNKEALPLFEQARNIFEALDLTDSLPYARNMLHLAQLHFTMGQHEEALTPAKLGLRILEIHEFDQIHQLLEGYVLIIKILQKLNDAQQLFVYSDNVYGVLERNMILQDKMGTLEFALSNILQAMLNAMSQQKREWLLQMIHEMNNTNTVDKEHHVQLYQEHLNHFLVALRQTELGSMVKLFESTLDNILANTERMINESDDQMDEDLKISVRLLESITFIMGPEVLQTILDS